MAAALADDQDEGKAFVLREKQVAEKQPDIDAIKQLLVTIGISLTDAGRHAESLVLDHKVNSVTKFQRKVGSDIAGYSATLQLDTDDVELLEEYFNQHTNVSTPPPPPPPPRLSSPSSTANSSAASAVGGAATRTPNHWTCFMVLSFPLICSHLVTNMFITHVDSQLGYRR